MYTRLTLKGQTLLQFVLAVPWKPKKMKIADLIRFHLVQIINYISTLVEVPEFQKSRQSGDPYVI